MLLVLDISLLPIPCLQLVSNDVSDIRESIISLIDDVSPFSLINLQPKSQFAVECPGR